MLMVKLIKISKSGMLREAFRAAYRSSRQLYQFILQLLETRPAQGFGYLIRQSEA